MTVRVMLLTTILMLPMTAAATDITGAIEEDTTWTAAGSPYVALDTFSIAEGVVLTAGPGVTLELAEDVDVYVYGELQFVGTPAEPVLITGVETEDGYARWGSFVFEESTVPAVFDEVDDYVGGTILEHCVFERGTRALRIGGASPYIHACAFQFNLASDGPDYLGGPAIVVRQGSAPRIVDCHFHDNEAETPYWGGAIYVHDANPVIQGCAFERNASAYGGAIAAELMYSPIVGNVFSENSAEGEGGAVSLVSCSLAFVDNHVTDNEAWWSDGGGVHVCVDCSPHSAPMMLDNTITENRALYHGAGGVGAAYIRAFSYNEIHGNTLDGEPSDFRWANEYDDPDWVRYPSIPNNWWGTTDTDAIDDAIHDGNDDSIYGIVDYEPILEGAPEGGTPRALITTRRIEYDAPDETMPTFLTLYNPGEERPVELAILLGVEEMPPTYYRGSLDFPGAEQGAETWTLALPAGAVYSTELLASVYTIVPELEYATWYAAIFDPDTGERIGDVSSARFDLGERGE